MRNLNDQDYLTVITICQKTRNDMTGWSSDVEGEREKLLEEVGCVCTTTYVTEPL